MKHLIYCVMCLGKEVKMYHMNSTMTKIYYEFILTSQKTNVTQMYACYECAYLLYKYDEFKRKCCKAYDILCNLHSERIEVTGKYLSSIDRKQNGLMTKLTSHTFTYDYQPKEQACGSYEDLNSDNDKYANIPSENMITYNDDNLVDIVQLQPYIESAPQDNIEQDYTHIDFVSGPEHDIEIDQVPFDFQSTQEHDIGNDYQFAHTYQVESTNYMPDAESMMWVTTQNTTVGDIEPDSGTPTQFHQECFDTANDYVLDKLLDMDGTKYEKGAVKIKCDTAKGSETNKTLETVNDEEYTQIINKESQNKHDTVNYYDLDKLQVIDGTKDEKGAVNIKWDTAKGSETSKILETVNDEEYTQITNKESQNNENRSSDWSDTEDSISLPNDTSLESYLSTQQVTVTPLTPQEARREFLLRMKTNNYVNSPYTCELCYRGCLTELSYESHMKRHTLVHGEFECHICKMRYPTENYRNQHVIRVHTRRFSCKICPYVCYNLTQWNAHIQTHEGKIFTCKICKMTFGYRISLHTHMRFKHGVELACEFCGNTFGSEQGLFSHKSLKHRGEKNEHLGPKCDECNVHFESEVAFKRHRVLSSRHKVKFGCKVCGDVFEDRIHLRRHSRVHGTKDKKKRGKPHVKKCLFCNVTLPYESDLRKHILSEHPTESTTGNLKKIKTKDYACEVCGKPFANRSFLAAHQKRHLNPTPFSCPECGWKTKLSSRLETHMRLHNENNKKFECDLCGGKFSEKSGIAKHMKGHLGIRPFKCAACSKTFRFRCEERTHYKHVHENVPYPKKSDGPKKQGERKRRTKGTHEKRIKVFDNI